MLGALLAVAIGSCGSGGGPEPSSAVASVPSQAAAAAAAAGTGSHIVVIVMENKEYGDVIGSPSSPYVNELARRYASATHAYGVTHPSLPNYFALTAGSTLGVTQNCTDCQQSAPNIASQLQGARVSWKAYMGGMPSACFKGASSGQYAKKHDPFMYYRNIADDPKRCAKVVPDRQLASDLRAGRLPRFAFLSPGLCDDTHDCPLSTGDAYLKRIVPAILGALGPRGFLVLTWDEGSSNAGCCGGRARGGRIPTIIAGKDVKRGALKLSFTHYSTLRTIEQALRLPLLKNAASGGTPSLNAAFKHPPRVR